LLKQRHVGKSFAYNFVLVKEWLVLIPRANKGRDEAPTNSAGMMGMVWVRTDEERRRWTELGMVRYLASLGIPKDN